MHAANTQGLVDDGDCSIEHLFFCERQYLGTKQRCKASNCVVAAWRAEIDRNTVVDDGLGVWATTRVAALGTLGLWKQLVDFINELS